MDPTCTEDERASAPGLLSVPESLHFKNSSFKQKDGRTRLEGDFPARGQRGGSTTDDMAESSEISSEDEETDEITDNSDKSPFETILSYREGDEGEYEYFIKLKNRPYRDSRWVKESEFASFPHKFQAAKRFRKKFPIPPSEPFYEPAYDEIDRIIAVDKSSEPYKYFVKWCVLNYDECTWEINVDKDALEKFERYNTPDPEHVYKPESEKTETEKFHYPDPKSWEKIDEFPSPDGSLELFSYQLEGVNWLRQRWYERTNCILADEMGLGKTVQAVTFLVSLHKKEKLPTPYLIVAPRSTLPNWEREFHNWSDFNVIVYTGNREARNNIRQYEFAYENGDMPKFDVLITNYELILNDTDVFTEFDWSVLIVDEAHRLKNSNSKLLQALSQVKSETRVLLTGTPIQNNIEELQSLLEFLHPGEFQDLNSAATSQDIIKLQSMLKPHLLRRLKVDVDKTIARKEETIIECGMSKYQKRYYKAILESNAGNLTHGSNCSNVAMELRKVCIHPYLIKGAEDEIVKDYRSTNDSPNFTLEALIRSSGKMVLIDKLLPKLFADKHRILIFSQMTNMLDILQDYLAMKGYSFLRIDGKVRGDLRQSLIDKFNAPDSDIFIFLLCTRAGGQGINLNSADTVIIFDSDWNPQNDLQAQARCHRIGQKKTVKVYRLLTKDTYEQTMFESASKKLGLGHAVLDKAPKKDIDMLLRKGAYHALNDVEEDNFGEQDIEDILRGSKIMVYNEAAGSTFSKANFDLTADSVDGLDINDPNFWQKILPQKPEVEEEKVEEGRMRTRHRQSTAADEEDPNLDDGTSPDWKRSEREKLQHLLQWYGWDRWADAEKLTGLKRPVNEIKLASRAFLRKLLSAETDLSQYTTARNLLERACTKEFDPNFIGADDASAVDDDFMRQSSMIDTEFVSLVQKKGSTWIKRIEMLYYLNMAVEKANRNPEEIFVPAVQGSNPAEDWWCENDDRYLIYGTWKNGFSRTDEILGDEELKFTFKGDDTKSPPQKDQLTPRVRKLANGLKRYFSGETRHNENSSYEPSSRRDRLWLKRDKSTVLQQMLHGGVPLKENGDYDWAQFREICGFTDKTDEQMEAYVMEMMEAGTNEEHEKGEEHVDDEKEQDDDEKGAESNGTAVTASRISQRFKSLTQLRKVFLKYTKAEVAEYFTYIPRWRNVPRTWDDKHEFEFFKAISERGWGVCADILKSDKFEGVFKDEPPAFVTTDARVMKRLNFVLEYIQKNALETLRSKEANSESKKKKAPKEQKDILDLPQVEMGPDGEPKMPLALTSTSWIVSLGHIVSDRSGFHTRRYIYPAGFKSTRLYASTLDTNVRVRYNCEIIDNGDAVPLFRVSMEDKPEVKYEGNSPTSPWTLILKRILELRPEKTISISGPEIFGLADPKVIYCIQRMKGANECVNYIPRQFSDKPAPPKTIKRRSQHEEQQGDPANPGQPVVPKTPVKPEQKLTPQQLILIKQQQLLMRQQQQQQQQPGAKPPQLLQSQLLQQQQARGLISQLPGLATQGQQQVVRSQLPPHLIAQIQQQQQQKSGQLSQPLIPQQRQQIPGQVLQQMQQQHQIPVAPKPVQNVQVAQLQKALAANQALQAQRMQMQAAPSQPQTLQPVVQPTEQANEQTPDQEDL